MKGLVPDVHKGHKGHKESRMSESPLTVEIKRQLSLYVDEQKWPTWNVFWKALERLRANVEINTMPAVSDIGLAGSAISLFAHMAERIRRQRVELAALNAERDKGWLADGAKTIWLDDPRGGRIVAVLVGRNVVGLITVDQTYGHLWSCGDQKGEEVFFGRAIQAVTKAWSARSKIEVPTGTDAVGEL